MGEPHSENDKNEFEQAADSGSQNVFAEFAEFLMTNKKWWLTPVVAVLLLVSVLVVLGGGAAAPFIYALF